MHVCVCVSVCVCMCVCVCVCAVCVVDDGENTILPALFAQLFFIGTGGVVGGRQPGLIVKPHTYQEMQTA